MNKDVMRWGVALSFLAFLAGCKGCTVIPKTEDNPSETRPSQDADGYREAFLEILRTKTVPRSLLAQTGNVRSTDNVRSADRRLMDSTRSTDTRSDNPRSDNPRSMDTRSADTRSDNTRSMVNFRYESDGRELRIIGPKSSRLGTYFISQSGKPNGINLQAPHGDSDLKTGDIAELLCKEHNYDSCSINTQHRRKFDFAHEPRSPFQDFTEAVVTNDPNALIVQLHGFESSKRRHGREQAARMILSTGQDSRALRAALASLQLDNDPGILVYGVDTQELGATRNVQAGLLKTLGKGHFLHIETSLEYREKLQNDRKERDFLDRIIRTVKKKYAEDHH